MRDPLQNNPRLRAKLRPLAEGGAAQALWLADRAFREKELARAFRYEQMVLRHRARLPGAPSYWKGMVL